MSIGLAIWIKEFFTALLPCGLHCRGCDIPIRPDARLRLLGQAQVNGWDPDHIARATNLEGFIFITHLAVKQILSQGAGGSVTSITTSLVENPIAGVPVSIPMITKGGLNAITLSLASEYAKNKIRFNAVAPGIVDTPLHKNDPKDIADAVIYLAEVGHVTGEALHVDDGAHVGRW